MESTQVLFSESFNEVENIQEKLPVATLAVDGVYYTIYNSENIIGRDESCNITIKNDVVSSKHAVIEADDPNAHLICDLGSTNKTRIGKVALKPHVRYIINDGDRILFGNVPALYNISKQYPPTPEKDTSNYVPETPEKEETPVNVVSDSSPEKKEDSLLDKSDTDLFDEKKVCVTSNSHIAVTGSSVEDLKEAKTNIYDLDTICFEESDFPNYSSTLQQNKIDSTEEKPSSTTYNDIVCSSQGKTEFFHNSKTFGHDVKSFEMRSRESGLPEGEQNMEVGSSERIIEKGTIELSNNHSDLEGVKHTRWERFGDIPSPIGINRSNLDFLKCSTPYKAEDVSTVENILTSVKETHKFKAELLNVDSAVKNKTIQNEKDEKIRGDLKGIVLNKVPTEEELLSQNIDIFETSGQQQSSFVSETYEPFPDSGDETMSVIATQTAIETVCSSRDSQNLVDGNLPAGKELFGSFLEPASQQFDTIPIRTSIVNSVLSTVDETVRSTLSASETIIESTVMENKDSLCIPNPKDSIENNQRRQVEVLSNFDDKFKKTVSKDSTIFISPDKISETSSEFEKSVTKVKKEFVDPNYVHEVFECNSKSFLQVDDPKPALMSNIICPDNINDGNVEGKQILISLPSKENEKEYAQNSNIDPQDAAPYSSQNKNVIEQISAELNTIKKPITPNDSCDESHLLTQGFYEAKTQQLTQEVQNVLEKREGSNGISCSSDYSSTVNSNKKVLDHVSKDSEFALDSTPFKQVALTVEAYDREDKDNDEIMPSKTTPKQEQLDLVNETDLLTEAFHEAETTGPNLESTDILCNVNSDESVFRKPLKDDLKNDITENEIVDEPSTILDEESHSGISRTTFAQQIDESETQLVTTGDTLDINGDEPYNILKGEKNSEVETKDSIFSNLTPIAKLQKSVVYYDLADDSCLQSQGFYETETQPFVTSPPYQGRVDGGKKQIADDSVAYTQGFYEAETQPFDSSDLVDARENPESESEIIGKITVEPLPNEPSEALESLPIVPNMAQEKVNKNDDCKVKSSEGSDREEKGIETNLIDDSSLFSQGFYKAETQQLAFESLNDHSAKLSHTPNRTALNAAIKPNKICEKVSIVNRVAVDFVNVTDESEFFTQGFYEEPTQQFVSSDTIDAADSIKRSASSSPNDTTTKKDVCERSLSSNKGDQAISQPATEILNEFRINDTNAISFLKSKTNLKNDLDATLLTQGFYGAETQLVANDNITKGDSCKLPRSNDVLDYSESVDKPLRIFEKNHPGKSVSAENDNPSTSLNDLGTGNFSVVKDRAVEKLNDVSIYKLDTEPGIFSENDTGKIETATGKAGQKDKIEIHFTENKISVAASETINTNKKLFSKNNSKQFKFRGNVLSRPVPVLSTPEITPSSNHQAEKPVESSLKTNSADCREVTMELSESVFTDGTNNKQQSQEHCNTSNNTIRDTVNMSASCIDLPHVAQADALLNVPLTNSNASTIDKEQDILGSVPVDMNKDKTGMINARTNNVGDNTPQLETTPIDDVQRNKELSITETKNTIREKPSLNNSKPAGKVLQCKGITGNIISDCNLSQDSFYNVRSSKRNKKLVFPSTSEDDSSEELNIRFKRKKSNLFPPDSQEFITRSIEDNLSFTDNAHDSDHKTSNTLETNSDDKTVEYSDELAIKFKKKCYNTYPSDSQSVDCEIDEKGQSTNTTANEPSNEVSHANPSTKITDDDKTKPIAENKSPAKANQSGSEKEPVFISRGNVTFHSKLVLDELEEEFRLMAATMSPSQFSVCSSGTDNHPEVSSPLPLRRSERKLKKETLYRPLASTNDEGSSEIQTRKRKSKEGLKEIETQSKSSQEENTELEKPIEEQNERRENRSVKKLKKTSPIKMSPKAIKLIEGTGDRSSTSKTDDENNEPASEQHSSDLNESKESNSENFEFGELGRGKRKRVRRSFEGFILDEELERKSRRKYIYSPFTHLDSKENKSHVRNQPCTSFTGNSKPESGVITHTISVVLHDIKSSSFLDKSGPSTNKKIESGCDSNDDDLILPPKKTTNAIKSLSSKSSTTAKKGSKTNETVNKTQSFSFSNKLDELFDIWGPADTVKLSPRLSKRTENQETMSDTSKEVERAIKSEHSSVPSSSKGKSSANKRKPKRSISNEASVSEESSHSDLSRDTNKSFSDTVKKLRSKDEIAEESSKIPIKERLRRKPNTSESDSQSSLVTNGETSLGRKSGRKTSSNSNSSNGNSSKICTRSANASPDNTTTKIEHVKTKSKENKVNGKKKPSQENITTDLKNDSQTDSKIRNTSKISTRSNKNNKVPSPSTSYQSDMCIMSQEFSFHENTSWKKTPSNDDFKPPQFTVRRSSRSKKNERKSERNEKVMFTGFFDRNLAGIVTNLGGEVVDSPFTCTVLVTDKVRRTAKFLSSLARGLPIVIPEWLNHSNKAGHFSDFQDFIVADIKAEKQYAFSLKESIEKAKSAKLLDGWSVFVTSSVQPSPEDIKSIIESSGGKYLTKVPSRWPPSSFVISCPDDEIVWSSLTKRNKTPPIVNTEALFSGILKQTLNFENYLLV